MEMILASNPKLTRQKVLDMRKFLSTPYKDETKQIPEKIEKEDEEDERYGEDKYVFGNMPIKLFYLNLMCRQPRF